MPDPPLWAPWRMEYVLGPKAKGSCIFCFGDDAEDAELASRLVVCSTPSALVILNRYPFAAGHLMVLPRRHASFLEELNVRPAVRYLASVRDGEGAAHGA